MGNRLNDNDRLIEIETKLAYQEDLLQSLNDIIIEQRAALDMLELRLAKLDDRVEEGDATSREGGGNLQDELPPHY